MSARGAALALALAVLAACDGGTDAPEPWFEEVALARGLAFEHESGFDGESYLMPEIMGGGAALFDMDGDGDLDAYLVQSGTIGAPQGVQPPNRLFENDGTGAFRDVTDASGAGHRGYGMGVACGDVDGDADVDLYVTNLGPDALLANDGSGRFDDVTAASGTGNLGWGTSAAFFDMDRDGALDLYVCNYLAWEPTNELPCKNPMGTADYCSPLTYESPAIDVLYRNRGDGTFEDVTRKAGVEKVGTGLGVGCADFDDDGDTDVFVANDGMPNFLWSNGGDGTFEDVALLAGCAVDRDGTPKAGMGVAIADVDDDGDADLFVCNLARESDSFYRNDGGRFRDRTPAAGLASTSKPFTRFGLGLVDFDCDGWLDLFLANGRVARKATAYTDDPYAEPNLVFRGSPGPRFEEVLPRGGTARELAFTSRAAAFGDVDDDGAIDVLVVNRDGPAHLLRNLARGERRWLSLQLVERGGADALGALVQARVGGRTVTRTLRTAFSYLASSEPRVHLGLGDAEAAEDVVVTWLDGERESFGDLAANARHVLRRGTGAAR